MAKFWQAPFKEKFLMSTGFVSGVWQRWINSLRNMLLDHELTHLYRINDEVTPSPGDLNVWDPFADSDDQTMEPPPEQSPVASLIHEIIDPKEPPVDPLMELVTRPSDETDGFLSGMIVLWSGAIVDIPSGWALCDGNNGTPNLRNRFVVGAGSTYAVDASGGNTIAQLAAVQLLETNLPAHTHTTLSGGSHLGHCSDTEGVAAGSDVYPVTECLGAQGTHVHGPTGSTGDGTTLDLSPPYYALAYIMKL